MIATAKRKWLAMGLLLGVQFMVVLDIAIVNVALPSIQTDLGFSQENLQWVVSAYALLFGGFLLLFGRVADIVGRRRVFLVGIAVFSIASLLSGLAWSEGALIGARALQGLSAAAVMLAAFLAWERRTAEPLVPGSFFRLRTVVGANVAGLILGTAIFAMFLMLTLYMQQVLGYSAMRTGIAYLAV